MPRYDLESKISLINKYIQLNIIKTHGKILHNEIPENDLFAAIIDDMKEVHELPEKEVVSLLPIINGLKSLREMQTNASNGLDSLHAGLESMLKSIESIREEQSDPEVSLDSLIEDLESIDKMHKQM